MARGKSEHLKNVTPEQRKEWLAKAQETRKTMKEHPELALKKLSPLKAIRAKCKDCCAGSTDEVKLCTIKTCSLWIYRFGKRPVGAPTDTEEDTEDISLESGDRVEETKPAIINKEAETKLDDIDIELD